MTFLPIADRVQRGAQLLDETFPGWVDDIDISTLNLASGCDCILGQKFGDFAVGSRRVRLSVETSGVTLGDASRRLLADHGFLVNPENHEVRIMAGALTGRTIVSDQALERIEAEYTLLTQAWAQLITDRRAEAQLAEVKESTLVGV